MARSDSTSADVGRHPVEVHAIALWPGAGSSRDHSSLLAIEEGLAPIVVERFDQIYIFVAVVHRVGQRDLEPVAKDMRRSVGRPPVLVPAPRPELSLEDVRRVLVNDAAEVVFCVVGVRGIQVDLRRGASAVQIERELDGSVLVDPLDEPAPGARLAVVLKR